MSSVHMVIRRKNVTIHIVTINTTQVFELKKTIESILNISPEDQQLYFKDEIMDENMTLEACHVNSTNASLMRPATIGLAVKMENGKFEDLHITPYTLQDSSPEQSDEEFP